MSETQITRNLTGRRLLLAEDEMAVALSTAMLLEIEGGEVIKIARCQEGLAWLKDAVQKLSAAILDVTLADGPVYPLAEALAECQIPFVFVTGYGNDHLPVEWRDRPILEKPTDPDILIDWLASNTRPP